jgi:hypothetical protein
MQFIHRVLPCGIAVFLTISLIAQEPSKPTMANMTVLRALAILKRVAKQTSLRPRSVR